MAYPTTASQTELEAINQMLAAVGQAPVTSIDLDDQDLPTNPDVAMARETLQQASREVQAEGWTFNKEYHYLMTRTEQDNGEMHIIIPSSMMQCDLSMHEYYNRNKDSVRRNGKLYDRTAHTFNWEQDVYCDVMWYFAWEELPIPIQEYIVNKASATFSLRIVGDSNLYQFLTAKALECRTYALEYETQQGDFTFFGTPEGQNYYNSYQPFHTLYR